jgi:NAD(P)-dependent dehydrogenase (short-subunit alcohol dehydrogenase family)
MGVSKASDRAEAEGEVDPILFFSRDHNAPQHLAAALGDTRRIEVPVPSASDGDAVGTWPWADALDAWRSDVHSRLQPATSAVVCTWGDPPTRRPFRTVDASGWARFEAEWAAWLVALQLSLESCADGGAVVLVTELPVALDAEGFAVEVALSQGLVSFARSLAAAEGRRGVRVNSVTTELWTAPKVLVGSQPFLAQFPGGAQAEVAGAVRMLLGADAAGVSGWTVPADCGRTW